MTRHGNDDENENDDDDDNDNDLSTGQGTSNDDGLWTVVVWSLQCRMFVIVALALSCSVMPDFDPGDDVLRFPLRLSPRPSEFWKYKHRVWSRAFQSLEELTGIHVPLLDVDDNDNDNNDNDNDRRVCGASCHLDVNWNWQESPNNNNASRIALLDVVYYTVLTPMTRWDAARLLMLAADPSVRDPYRNDHDDDDCYDDDDDDSSKVRLAEQSHAFFPLVPFVIRQVAHLLRWTVPSPYLPATWEGVVTLAGLVVSTIGSTVASMALYGLTRTLTESTSVALGVTRRFVWCPSALFFTVPYTESVFAAATFVGYYLYVSIYVSIYLSYPSGCRCLLWGCFPLVAWGVASSARSNGSVQILYGLVAMLGWFVNLCWYPETRSLRSCFRMLLVAGSMLVVVVPGLLHDQWGYDRFCGAPSSLTETSTSSSPWWCGNNQTYFSLYAHVQRTHWNVGWFRYYQLKQIPNFLLAAPTVWISVNAVVTWIRTSWTRYERSSRTTTKGPLTRLLSWACHALADIDADADAVSGGRRTHTPWNTHTQPPVTDTVTTPDSVEARALALLGPSTLPFYLVLAATVFVGVTIAHVEITTRLVCSTCPAFYWYAYYSQLSSRRRRRHRRQSTTMDPSSCGVLPTYFYIYTFLGILLFPNWLRWT